MGLLRRLLIPRGAPQDGAADSSAPSPAQPPDEQGATWYVPQDGDKSRFVGDPPPLHLIPYRDSRGERVLRLCEDRTGLLVGPTDRRLPSAGIYVSQLRGEAYHQSGCRLGNFSAGASVQLRREPDNAHDPLAVAVFDATGKHKAAYVNKQKARMLAKRLDAGEQLTAISIRGTRAGQPCEQVAILAATPSVVATLTDVRSRRLPPPAHLA